MKSSLDGRPSAFSDSTRGPVCLFLFVDSSSWPNLTAACAAQVAKQGLRHGYTFWRARCRFRNRGLVTILVHLYLYNLIYITTLPEKQDSCFVFVSEFKVIVGDLPSSSLFDLSTNLQT